MAITPRPSEVIQAGENVPQAGMLTLLNALTDGVDSIQEQIDNGEIGGGGGGGGGGIPRLAVAAGDGVETDFTLSGSPVSKESLLVTLSGVIQHTDAFTLTGNTLSFTAAPPDGVAIEVRDLATVIGATETPEAYGAVGDGATDDSAAWDSFIAAIMASGKPGYLTGKYLIPSANSVGLTGHVTLVAGSATMLIDGGPAGVTLFHCVSAGFSLLGAPERLFRTNNVAVCDSFNLTTADLDAIRLRHWRWTNTTQLVCLVRINYDSAAFHVEELEIYDVVGQGGLGGVHVIAPIRRIYVDRYRVRGIVVPNDPAYFSDITGKPINSGYGSGLNLGDDDGNAMRLTEICQIGSIAVEEIDDQRVPALGDEGAAVDGARIEADNVQLGLFMARSIQSASKNDTTGLYVKGRHKRIGDVFIVDGGGHEACVVFKGQTRAEEDLEDPTGFSRPGFNTYVKSMFIRSTDPDVARSPIYVGSDDIRVERAYFEGVGGEVENPWGRSARIADLEEGATYTLTLNGTGFSHVAAAGEDEVDVLTAIGAQIASRTTVPGPGNKMFLEEQSGDTMSVTENMGLTSRLSGHGAGLFMEAGPVKNRISFGRVDFVKCKFGADGAIPIGLFQDVARLDIAELIIDGVENGRLMRGQAASDAGNLILAQISGESAIDTVQIGKLIGRNATLVNRYDESTNPEGAKAIGVNVRQEALYDLVEIGWIDLDDTFDVGIQTNGGTALKRLLVRGGDLTRVRGDALVLVDNPDKLDEITGDPDPQLPPVLVETVNVAGVVSTVPLLARMSWAETPDSSGYAYDGTSDFLKLGSDLTGAADGDGFTLAMEIRFDGKDGTLVDVFQGTGAVAHLYKQASNFLRLRVEDTLGAAVIDEVLAVALTDDNQFHHLFITGSTAVDGRFHWYLDGESQIDQLTGSTEDFDLTAAQWAVMADVGGSDKVQGSIRHVFFDNAFTDPATHLDRFISPTGQVMDLGDDGSEATGVQPLIYMRNGRDNLGRGGAFTVNGAPAGILFTLAMPYTVRDRWKASKAYAANARAYDHLTGEAYKATAALAAAGSGTFEDYRTANPGDWEADSQVLDGFNDLTHRFICPVAGVYWVLATATFTPPGSGAYSGRLRIKKDNGVQAATFAETRRPVTDVTPDDGIEVSAMIQAAAGDEIFIEAEHDDSAGSELGELGGATFNALQIMRVG